VVRISTVFLICLATPFVNSACSFYIPLSESGGHIGDDGGYDEEGFEEPRADAWDDASDDNGETDDGLSNGNLEWVVRAGGEYHAYGFQVSALPDGSVVVTGRFVGTAIFGPGESNETSLHAFGDIGIFVARYNPQGTLAWSRGARYALKNLEPILHVPVSVLPDGSSVITGNFFESITFGNGSSDEVTLRAEGESDVFLARYDHTGSLIWATRAGGDCDEISSAVTFLPDGSSLLLGRFGPHISSVCEATFGRGEPNETLLTGAGKEDVFIARYNPDGTLAWVRRAGGIDNDFSGAITAFADGAFMLAGSYRDSATFGPGEPGETVLTTESQYGYGVFVAGYKPDGDLDWVRKAGEGGGLMVNDMESLPDGSFIIAGHFESAVTFGNDGSNEVELGGDIGHYEAFVSKYTQDGTFLWAKQAGGRGWEYRPGISAFEDGSFIMTGGFGSTATFGSGEANETRLTSEGGRDIFIALYNAEGEVVWARREGGSHEDRGEWVSSLEDGSIFITGYFSETVAFGAGGINETVLTSEGERDIFVMRLSLQ
jgi:hypothetical protein